MREHDGNANGLALTAGPLLLCAYILRLLSRIVHRVGATLDTRSSAWRLMREF
jgi:hypothetical protein